MPDMLIAHINKLGCDQPKRLTFTDRHSPLSGYVKISVVGVESDKEEVKLPEIELEGNFELPGVDAKGREASQFVEIYDANIPPDPHPIESEPDNEAEFEVPAAPEVITLANVEPPGLHRSTQVRYQIRTCATSMKFKSCAYSMMQQDSQGVINPDAHMFAQGDF